MNPIKFIKSFIFWEVGRNNWRYELLCVVYIAALVFLPTNSNGWFNDGEQVALPDESVIILHRIGTDLFISWNEDDNSPDPEVINKFIAERFGERSVTVSDSDRGPHYLRVIPGGWK